MRASSVRRTKRRRPSVASSAPCKPAGRFRWKLRWPSSATSGSERGRLVWGVADLVENNIDELAELETHHNRKPIFESKFVDMPMVVDVLRYCGGLATKMHGETVNTFESGFTYTLREPVGV